MVLGSRIILLLSLIGAFVLALMASYGGNWMGIGLFVAYCAMTVLPLVWLDWNGRRAGG